MAEPCPRQTRYLFPSPEALSNASFNFLGDFNPFGLSYQVGELANNVQHQFNVTDNASWTLGTHQLKFGIDYRRLNPEEKFSTYQLLYIFRVPGECCRQLGTRMSSYIQNAGCTNDHVRLESLRSRHMERTRNLTVTYGVRWEYNTPILAVASKVIGNSGTTGRKTATRSPLLMPNSFRAFASLFTSR